MKKEDKVSEAQMYSAMKAILMLDHSKKGIKQSEVFKAMPDPPPRTLAGPLFDAVRKKMLEMGLALHFIDGQCKTMFVSSAERDRSYMMEAASQEERANRTLLLFVLSYIFMKDDMGIEDEFFKFLNKIHIYNEGTPLHLYFGDVKKKIQSQFVDEMYLERTQVPDSGQVELQWGHRAKAEVSKMDALEFVCKIAYNGQRKPEDFTLQYQKALAAQEEDQDDDNSDSEDEEEEEIVNNRSVSRVAPMVDDDDDDDDNNATVVGSEETRNSNDDGETTEIDSEMDTD